MTVSTTLYKLHSNIFSNQYVTSACQNMVLLDVGLGLYDVITCFTTEEKRVQIMLK